MKKLSDGFVGRKDRRSASRRGSGSSEAWIKLGGVAVRRCVIADVSAYGVQLIIDASIVVPREFELTTAKGVLGRKCRIKWRNATQLGALFV